MRKPCPFYPRKRTFMNVPAMSAKCHKRTLATCPMHRGRVWIQLREVFLVYDQSSSIDHA